MPIPPEGPGTFAVAPGGSEQILRDPRGWTAGGQWSFQRVSGGPADFLLRLATPATVDNICGMYWLNTGGELSCRAGEHVMINLKRWVLGVPHFDGDLATYREYLINHEVGHRLGHGHVGCPEPGGLAPVMAPQTLDLDGCRRNGWPYPDGEFLTGPPRP